MDAPRTPIPTRDKITPILLILATLAVYAQVRHFDFINFDDNVFVYEHDLVLGGLTWSGVWTAFTTAPCDYYRPLSWVSHMLDVSLFGLNAGGHHVTNVLIHLVNTLLLYAILKRAAVRAGAVDFHWPAAWIAALFALHPLHVESVAWVAERKDVLSTALGFLTILAYLSYTACGGAKRYLLVLALAGAAMATKPMLVTLPAVLLLLDYWPLRRLDLSWRSWKRPVVEKLPLLAMALVTMVATYVVQHEVGTVTGAALPLADRLGNAARSYAIYVGKMFWPTNLAIFYPHPSSRAIGGLDPTQVAVSVVFLALVSAACVYAAVRFNRRYLLVGWLWFLGTLLPVIGLVQSGGQAYADRYTYVPLIGVWIMLGFGAAELIRHRRAFARPLAVVGVVSVVAAAAVTYVHLPNWQNSITICSHAVRVTQNNYKMHANLGVALKAAAEREKDPALFALAQQHLEEALRIRPTLMTALIGLGDIHRQQGNLADAERCFRKALELEPADAGVHYGLAVVLTFTNRLDEATAALERTLALKPDDALAHNLMAVICDARGQTAEAIEHYTTAVTLAPGRHEFLINLAELLATHPDGRFRNGAAAVELAGEACRITGYADHAAVAALAGAYGEVGDFDAASQMARAALELVEDDSPAAADLRQRLAFFDAHQPYRRNAAMPTESPTLSAAPTP